MASSNQLRARVPDEQMEYMERYAQEHDIRETDAERAIFEAGLIQLGYLEDHSSEQSETDHSQMLLEGARKTGVLLGVLGFVFVGYSVFAPDFWGYVGFGTLLSGFGAIAGSEFAPWVEQLIRGSASDSADTGDPA